MHDSKLYGRVSLLVELNLWMQRLMDHQESRASLALALLCLWVTDRLELMVILIECVLTIILIWRINQVSPPSSPKCYRYQVSSCYFNESVNQRSGLHTHAPHSVSNFRALARHNLIIVCMLSPKIDASNRIRCVYRRTPSRVPLADRIFLGKTLRDRGKRDILNY